MKRNPERANRPADTTSKKNQEAPPRPATDGNTAADDESIRLSKRVAAQFSCSRSEAELYIEGGWVRVDGKVIEMPQFRVGAQTVTLDADASLTPLPSVTLIYNKPPGQVLNTAAEGVRCLDAAPRWIEDPSGITGNKRYLNRLSLPCLLEATASGLVVLTQDGRVARKLVQDAALVEHEIIVEVVGGQSALSGRGLKLLNYGLSFQDKPVPPCKVSWQNENRLRFAIKNPLPGQIAEMCVQVNLDVVSIKRIRIGRLPMAGLPMGQWRFLGEQERF